MDPTIKHVAKKANVSTATVSRILNNKPGFSLKTKKRVLEVIEELGYQPNAIARGLINGKTETIGVLMPRLLDMFASRVLEGIDEYVHERGSSVIVCNTDNNRDRTMKYLQFLGEKRVDGIIFVSQLLEEDYYRMMADMKIPIILVSTISYEFQLPYVKVDDYHAAFSATQYLIQKGHKKIAMIAGEQTDPVAGIPRIEGFKSALKSAGLTPDDRFIVSTGGYSHSDGKRGMEQILARGLDVTSVFACSDELAVGAMSVAYKKGISIPDDLSIIGYDNTPLAEMSFPPLTTVAQPLYDMGNKSAEMLFNMMETGERSESRIMQHKVIERETVKEILC
ncbi:transcriptional regulator, LacI family [Bacillus sp. OV322]|uniref:LacI family DNA-binding transcriptional regulator n=1 Tax=Bacillus sp. OV322 TaxID=1882764 RepID=UPI0008EDEFFE|nr:LacI family DNA-binding transcriptional regulator [Bacillus sp. OV322]SFC93920.1 transcriptional regulator, LacI family [Bacillus sp. OV322]